MKRKELLILLLILLVHQIVNAFLLISLFPLGSQSSNFFFADLININLKFNYFSLYLIDGLNLLIIYLISKNVFKGSRVFIPIAIYALSFWTGYLVVVESIYILLLFLVLIGFYGLILFQKGNKKYGLPLYVVALIVGVYSSLSLAFVVVFEFLVLYLFGFFKKVRLNYGIFFVLTIPLIVFMFGNIQGVENILRREFKIFSDPGLLVTVNNFQGEARREGVYFLSRLSENKYIVFSEFVVTKFLRNISPGTYFTSEGKMLGFSFVPPILLGFLIPFFYGIFLIFNKKRNAALLTAPLMLVGPSLMSTNGFDLTRLVLIYPFLVLIISLGLGGLINKNSKIARTVLMLVIILLIFQVIITAVDIHQNERARFLKIANESVVMY